MTTTDRFLEIIGVSKEALVADAVNGYKQFANSLNHSDLFLGETSVDEIADSFGKCFMERAQEIIDHMKRMIFEFYTDEQMEDMIALYTKYPELIAHQKSFTNEMTKICMRIGQDCGEKAMERLEDGGESWKDN